MKRDEQYWKGFIAALKWVKSWYSISYSQYDACNEKIREIKKQHLKKDETDNSVQRKSKGED